MPRRYYDDFDERRQPNAIERDRMERRRQVRRKSMMTNIFVVAIAAIVVVGVIVAVIALTGKNNSQQPTEPTTVTATIAAETQKATTVQPTRAPQNSQYDQDDPYIAPTDSQDDDQTATQSAATSAPPQGNPGSATGGGSHTMHYVATGQTSYGYDWTYSGGGGIVDISCNYNFDAKQYDFSITGVSEGVATITLYYNTDDGVQQPVSMTVQVDSNLNVLQIG